MNQIRRLYDQGVCIILEFALDTQLLKAPEILLDVVLVQGHAVSACTAANHML